MPPRHCPTRHRPKAAGRHPASRSTIRRRGTATAPRGASTRPALGGSRQCTAASRRSPTCCPGWTTPRKPSPSCSPTGAGWGRCSTSGLPGARRGPMNGWKTSATSCKSPWARCPRPTRRGWCSSSCRTNPGWNRWSTTLPPMSANPPRAAASARHGWRCCGNTWATSAAPRGCSSTGWSPVPPGADGAGGCAPRCRAARRAGRVLLRRRRNRNWTTCRGVSPPPWRRRGSSCAVAGAGSCTSGCSAGSTPTRRLRMAMPMDS